MNVLSLFDGLSCGQIALEKAGIGYDKYYSSEIDQFAIKVTQSNYPDTIQLGDISNIKGAELPKIKLLIGGSPCQGFSRAGKQLNFDDPRSKLFFEYVRLLKECEPEYFLLENVVMKQEHQDVITSFLNTEPVEIDSSLVSPQSRKRLYWTNIPGVVQPDDSGMVLRDVIYPEGLCLEHGTVEDFINDHGVPPSQQNYGKESTSFHRFKNRTRTLYEKANCMTANMYKGMASNGVTNVIVDGFWRMLTPNECEQIQSVPIDYTSAASNTQRFKMLGNGWTVDIISHIFKGLK